ncbi:hypothetical protein [Microbacterium oleivorans]|uniref:Lipoprotein n=1 Tax=Microbacterium oleivorans TaxID=273677 RepID=A0A4V3B3P7_9MICO|nr:hypothetical protein [Microbacterium oleivorans]TDL45423.1 hypothetical protein E2R54_02870 [Microbacterium oleivorans]
MYRRVAGFAGVLAGAMLLAGCAAGVAVTAGGSATLITDAGFLSGDEALIEGTLTVAESGCVGIVAAGGETYPAVWPRGTTLVGGVDTGIDVPGVGVLRVGDAVSGAGGYYGVQSRPTLDEVADRCDWQGEVIGIRFD